MSYCKSPSVLIYHTIIFQMSPKWLFKITDSIIQYHDSYYQNLGMHHTTQILAKQFPLQGKKSPQLYHPPKARKPLIGDRKNPKISKFLSDTEGKVWRKSTKIWTVVHVKIFLNIARLIVPVGMSFCQGIKILRNLQLENFPSEAPFSSNLYHPTSTEDQNQLLRDVVTGCGGFSLSCR